jgi:hypothetical protein
MVAFIVFQTLKDSLYRLYLQNTSAILLGVAIYMVVSTAFLNIYFLVRPLKSNMTMDRKAVWGLATIWAVASIPEGIAFGHLPVYSLVAIGSISWIVVVCSDIYFKRMELSLRTAIFTGIVFVSIALSFVDRLV